MLLVLTKLHAEEELCFFLQVCRQVCDVCQAELYNVFKIIIDEISQAWGKHYNKKISENKKQCFDIICQDIIIKLTW